jgi:hypothetical protein
MMASLSKLQHRLHGLKIEDRSQPGRYFVPKSSLAEALPQEDIARAIAQPPFAIPLHRREDACDIITHRALVVFAIVVDTGLCQYLDPLLAEDLLDDRLPFPNSEAGSVFGTDANIFLAAQWTFLPHRFERHGYHKRLREGAVLPYTQVQPFGGGRCSKVYKVKIHPSCNNLFPLQTEKVHIACPAQAPVSTACFSTGVLTRPGLYRKPF